MGGGETGGGGGEGSTITVIAALTGKQASNLAVLNNLLILTGLAVGWLILYSDRI